MAHDRESDDAQDEKIGKAQRAERLLRVLLSGGNIPSKNVLEQMKHADISERTVRSVVKKIGVQAFRKGNVWYWKMGDQNNKDNKEG